MEIINGSIRMILSIIANGVRSIDSKHMENLCSLMRWEQQVSGMTNRIR